jgi:hypothetical protein
MIKINDSVFISYSNKDKDFVFKLKDDLNKNGVYTWVDVERIQPGAMWQDEIKNGLDKSSVIIIVLSENYFSSSWVAIEMALAKNKLIIPIKIDNALYTKIPDAIRDRQWIDFNENYQNGLSILLRAIPDRNKIKKPIRPNKIISKGYVFISFCDEDASFVSDLREFLKSQEFAYWDYEEGDRNYHIQFFLELESVIDDSIAVLSIISPSWKKSKWSTREYFYSDEIGKPIFLLRAKESKPILATAGQPYIDFVKNPQNGYLKLAKELRKRL